MMKILTFCCIFGLISGSILEEHITTVGVQNASQTDSPWYALIEIRSNGLRCGGSLFNDIFVVTAAHCLESLDGKLDTANLKRELIIKVGAWVTNENADCDDSNEDCHHAFEIQPKHAAVHELYDKSNKDKYDYDIAVIMLAWMPAKSEFIKNIELSTGSVKLVNQILTVTGFGQYKPGVYTAIKKKIQMKIFPDRFCEERHKGVYSRSKHMCGLGYEGVTTCSGDSGSGLVRTLNGTTYLEGITAFGVSICGQRDIPSGFIKVASFADWIKEQIKMLS